MSEPSFGRYESLFRIAAGGMAEVYAARIRGEAGFEKLVAIKRMLPHLADDADFVAMFLDEGRLAANIASPYVVSTLDLGRGDDGSLYIVMDLVVGVALSTLVRASRREQRPLPVPIACEIIAQAASGLDDAHEARTPTGVHLGIVHRDVSPQNILVGADGRARVVDFGVARAILRQSQTSAGTLKGKFGYFSPEQAAARDLDRRSDVFALGIVAWETLLSRRLFDADNPLEQITRVRSMPIPSPHKLRNDVSPAVSAVVMRALSRDLAGRYESAAAFATALRGALGTPVSAREVATLVNDIAAAPIRDMQSRIESAMAGEHLVTKHVRKPSPVSDPSQTTPSMQPAQVADLPTLVRTPTPASVSHALIEPRAAIPTRRWWIAGVAVSLFAAFVVAVLVRQSMLAPPQPVATPLGTTRTFSTTVTASPPINPATATLPIAAPPEPSALAPTARARHVAIPRTPAATTSPPPPSSAVHAEPPPPVTRAVVTPPPPASAEPVVRAAPPPPTTGATAPARHPAGLAGDDAFDRGL